MRLGQGTRSGSGATGLAVSGTGAGTLAIVPYSTQDLPDTGRGRPGALGNSYPLAAGFDHGNGCYLVGRWARYAMDLLLLGLLAVIVFGPSGSPRSAARSARACASSRTRSAASDLQDAVRGVTDVRRPPPSNLAGAFVPGVKTCRSRSQRRRASSTRSPPRRPPRGSRRDAGVGRHKHSRETTGFLSSIYVLLFCFEAPDERALAPSTVALACGSVAAATPPGRASTSARIGPATRSPVWVDGHTCVAR